MFRCDVHCRKNHSETLLRVHAFQTQLVKCKLSFVLKALLKRPFQYMFYPNFTFQARVGRVGLPKAFGVCPTNLVVTFVYAPHSY